MKDKERSEDREEKRKHGKSSLYKKRKEETSGRKEKKLEIKRSLEDRGKK